MRRRLPIGMLTFVIVLAVAGLVRIGLATGPAFAELAQSQQDVSAPSGEGQPVEPLLQALLEREVAIETRERALEERMAALRAAEETIAQRLAELEAAEASLAATIAGAETANDRDINALISVYESMKAEEAIPLFEAMPPDFAAGFIARMQPESAGPILAGLDPNLAFSISAIIAGRNADVPIQ